MLTTILIIVLILLLIGALPTWPHSAGWGYGPGGILGLILIIIIIYVDMMAVDTIFVAEISINLFSIRMHLVGQML